MGQPSWRWDAQELSYVATQEGNDGYLIVGFIILAILLVIFIALFSKWSD